MDAGPTGQPSNTTTLAAVPRGVVSISASGAGPVTPSEMSRAERMAARLHERLRLGARMLKAFEIQISRLEDGVALRDRLVEIQETAVEGAGRRVENLVDLIDHIEVSAAKLAFRTAETAERARRFRAEAPRLLQTLRELIHELEGDVDTDREAAPAQPATLRFSDHLRDAR